MVSRREEDSVEFQASRLWLVGEVADESLRLKGPSTAAVGQSHP